MMDLAPRHPIEEAFREAARADVEIALVVARNKAASETRRNAAVWSLLHRSTTELSEERRDGLIEEFLIDDSMDVQRSAISAGRLHRSPNRICHRLWLVAIGGTENSVYALRTLAQLGDGRVVEECRRLLQNGSHVEQEKAAIALGFLKTTDASLVLEHEFRSATSQCLKFFLAIGITRCGSDAGLSFLENYIRVADRTEWMICICMLAFGGSETAVAALEEFLSNATDGERTFVRQTLVTLGIEGAESPCWENRVLQSLRTCSGRRGWPEWASTQQLFGWNWARLRSAISGHWRS